MCATARRCAVVRASTPRRAAHQCSNRVPFAAAVSRVFPSWEVGRRHDRDGPVCDQVGAVLLQPALRPVTLFFQPLFLQFRQRDIFLSAVVLMGC